MYQKTLLLMYNHIMENLTCADCGSNDFKETDTAYVCSYCNASILKTAVPSNANSYPKKRLRLISLSLIVIVMMLFMGYRLLYDVKENVEDLIARPVPQYQEMPKEMHQEQSVDAKEKNPFSDTITKVESAYGNKNNGSNLEKALRFYHDMEKHKAFYLAIRDNGEYVFGYSYGAKDMKTAEKEALKFCEDQRKKMNLQDSCIPYALNNNISRLVF